MILTAKRLITGDGKTVIDNGAVLLKDGKIAAVGELNELKAQYPEVSCIEDYGNATLLPGLIDMHVHIGYWYNRKDKELYDKYLVGYMALDIATRAMQSGVTTMRDLSSAEGVCQSLIVASKKGFVRIPRIIHCNKALNATGGHAWQAGDSVVEVDGEDEIRKAVREQVRAGAQWIKVMSSHRTSGISEYTQHELDVAVDEARRNLRKTALHSSLQPSLEFGVNAGFDTIEHGTDLTEDQAKRMIAKGMAWTPTVLVHHNAYKRLQAIIDAGESHTLTEAQWQTYRIYGESNKSFRRNLKEFHEMGMTIVSGTDMIGEGAKPAPVAAELAVMVEYGIPPLEAIAIGTSNCAKVLGMEGEIGILAPGAAGDILVVEGDPQADIGSLEKVKAVWFAGEKV